MQSLNDDMDELFRRAGEEYPLKTDGADWDKVLQGLHQSEVEVPLIKDKRKDYRYLLLLLLLPLGVMIGRYAGSDKKVADSKSFKNVHAAASPSAERTTMAGSNATGQPAKVAEGKTAMAEKGIASNEKVSSGDNKTSTSPASRRAALSADNNKSGVNDVGGKSSGRSASTTGVTVPAVLSNKEAEIKPEQMKSGGNATTAEVTPASAKPAANASHTPSTADTSASAARDKNTTAQPAKSTTTAKTSIKSKAPSFKRSFYYSIVAGPDISTVKSSKTNKAGYSVGLMLGYNVASKLSVEAGALWDRKNYYASGSYLDTAKLGLPMRSVVSHVDGYCDMIEIPVNLSYKLLSRKKHSWFVSTGVSSYLMKNESYNISYQRYSMWYAKDYGYKNASTNWFSIMNVSAGYQATLGKNTNLSIAPYIKLPLRGVGIGKLPITSTGIYVSLSRPLW